MNKLLTTLIAVTAAGAFSASTFAAEDAPAPEMAKPAHVAKHHAKHHAKHRHSKHHGHHAAHAAAAGDAIAK